MLIFWKKVPGGGVWSMGMIFGKEIFFNWSSTSKFFFHPHSFTNLKQYNIHPFKSRSLQANIILSLYESGNEELNLSGNDCSEITSSQLLVALNHLRVLNLTAAKVETDTILQVMSEPKRVQRGRIVFSSSDFPSKNIQSRWGKKKIKNCSHRDKRWKVKPRGGGIRIRLHLTERYLDTWWEYNDTSGLKMNMSNFVDIAIISRSCLRLSHVTMILHCRWWEFWSMKNY